MQQSSQKQSSKIFLQILKEMDYVNHIILENKNSNLFSNSSDIQTINIFIFRIMKICLPISLDELSKPNFY